MRHPVLLSFLNPPPTPHEGRALLCSQVWPRQVLCAQ